MVDGIQSVSIRVVHPVGWNSVFNEEVYYFLDGEVRGRHSASPRARDGECRPGLGHERIRGVRGVVLLDPFSVSARKGAQAREEPPEDYVLAVGAESSQEPVTEY
jgi:hypothetical protein